MGFFTKVKTLIMASTGAKIAAGAIVAVVLGGTGLVFANTVGSPENVLGAAVVKTFTKETPAYEEVFGLTEFMTAVEKKGVEMSMDVSIKDIPLDSLGLGDMTLPSAGINMDVKQSPEGKEVATMTLKVADTSLVSLNMYADEKQMQVSAPELFQSVISFSYGEETLEEKLKASYVAEFLELTEEDIELFADSVSGTKEDISEEEMEQEMEKILMECYEAHLADTTVEKLDKEEVSVGDEVLKCKVFEIRMDAQKVNGFIKDVSTRMVAYFKELCVQQVAGMAEEDFASLEEALAEWEPGLQGEVVIKCYVTKGRLVDAIFNVTGADSAAYCVEMKFAPTGYAFDNMYCSLQAPELALIEVETKTENTKENYRTELILTSEGEPVVALSFDYEKENGEFTLTMVLEGESMAIDGIVKELEKGAVLDTAVETFRYSDGTTEVSQGVEASFRVAATEVEVVPLSGNQIDLLSMTEDDFDVLAEEISTNITSKVFQLFGLLQ